MKIDKEDLSAFRRRLDLIMQLQGVTRMLVDQAIDDLAQALGTTRASIENVLTTDMVGVSPLSPETVSPGQSR